MYLVDLPRVAERYQFRYHLTEAGPYVVNSGNSFSIITGKAVSIYWRWYSQ